MYGLEMMEVGQSTTVVCDPSDGPDQVRAVQHRLYAAVRARAKKLNRKYEITKDGHVFKITRVYVNTPTLPTNLQSPGDSKLR